MVRVIKGYEGDLDTPGCHREVEEYEVTCDECGDYIEGNEEVYVDDGEELCKRCLLGRYSAGSVFEYMDMRT